jgi:2-hydroxy-3-keto-5-methylthiopentenyl-1-phosphate phosphatase
MPKVEEFVQYVNLKDDACVVLVLGMNMSIYCVLQNQ